MKKTFVDIPLAQNFHVEYNGRKFYIGVTDYVSIGGYARVTIIDDLSGERFYSPGSIEIYGVHIITKWDTYVDMIADNIRYSKDLIVEVY